MKKVSDVGKGKPVTSNPKNPTGGGKPVNPKNPGKPDGGDRKVQG